MELQIPLSFDFDDVLVEYDYDRGEPRSFDCPGSPEQAHIYAVTLIGKMGINLKHAKLEITDFLSPDDILNLEEKVIDHEHEVQEAMALERRLQEEDRADFEYHRMKDEAMEYVRRQA